jgi:hypothetical protein
VISVLKELIQISKTPWSKVESKEGDSLGEAEI